MKKEKIRTILFIILIILSFFLGQSITERSINKRYKKILKNNLDYCIMGNYIIKHNNKFPLLKKEFFENVTNRTK